MTTYFRIITAFTILLLVLILNSVTVAQSNPPPPPLNGHNQTGNSDAGAGAPIGEGNLLLICLACLYATKKGYDYTKPVENE